MSVAKHIYQQVENMKKGQPFSPKQFIGLGNRNTIDKNLSRLAESGKIKRLTHGLYVRPKTNPYIGEVIPSVEEILKAISLETGETIQIHGAEAARQLGLSTQSPIQPTFLTSGNNRIINIGKLSIALKHTSPRKLIMPGTKIGLAITALWYLGKENVDLNTINKIRLKLSKPEFKKFVAQKPNMPAWMSDKVLCYERSI